MDRKSKYASVVVALVAGLFLACPALRAEEDCEDPAVRAHELRQRQAREARELVDRLGLSRTQARRLIPLAEEAAGLYAEAYEREAELLPQMLAAFAAFAQQDRLNQGFTPEVERRTARLNHQAKQIRERLDEQLVELEQRAGKILTAAQRERLEARPVQHRPLRPRVWRTDTRTRRRIAERQRAQARLAPLNAAREELRELHRQTHPRPGKLGRLVLHPFGAERLCELAGLRRVPEAIREAAEVLRSGTSECPLDVAARQHAEIRRLRAEINNWNLINGLHLSAEQIEQIVSRYEQAAAPSWQLVRRDPRTGLTRQALVKLEREVEKLLNSGQREVLAEYKACLIPPKKLKDPVRVGQASDYSRYERWLEVARKLPARRLGRHIDAVLEREAEHFGELSRSERQKRVILLRRTVAEAARMSDAEFEAAKAQLAEKIAAPDRAQEVKQRIIALSRELGEPGPIAQFMLNRQFIDQLRIRGQQLAAGVSLEPVDLAVGPQAENCATGCAIDGPRHPGKSDSE